MSFDTDFKYADMMVKLVDKANVYMDMAKQMGSIRDDAMQHIYEAKQKLYESLASDYTTAVAEIKAVQELSQESKRVLFQFYGHSAASQFRYMRVIAHSYEAMLKDDAITQLLKQYGEKINGESQVAGALILSKYTDSTAL